MRNHCHPRTFLSGIQSLANARFPIKAFGNDKFYIVFSFIIFITSPVYASAPQVCIKDTCVEVEVMTTPEEMQRGLQGRKSLENGHGMLFVFQNDGLQSFWMKKMNFAIDMLWINQGHRIVTIAADRPACVKDPCETYTSTQPSRFVLELPSGFSSQHQFHEGDVVEFKGIS